MTFSHVVHACASCTRLHRQCPIRTVRTCAADLSFSDCVVQCCRMISSGEASFLAIAHQVIWHIVHADAHAIHGCTTRMDAVRVGNHPGRTRTEPGLMGSPGVHLRALSTGRRGDLIRRDEQHGRHSNDRTDPEAERPGAGRPITGCVIEFTLNVLEQRAVSRC
jgi:hypothetical protein